MSRVQRLAGAPDRAGLTWVELWNGPDQGLIAAWEAGRRLGETRLDLAECCAAGELPELPWRGAARRLKSAQPRAGSLLYVAMWLGIQRRDLDLDPDEAVTLTCSAIGAKVVYTLDAAAWRNAPDEHEC